MKMNRIWGVLSALILAVVLCMTAGAEDWEMSGPVVLDAFDDQEAYTEMIVQMNMLVGAAQVHGGPEDGPGETLTAVLCRTDGTVSDFARWGPAYVLRGPDNCCVLYFESSQAAQRAIEELNQLSWIRYAEPDREVRACTEDISFVSWGAEQMHFGSFIPYVQQWGQGGVMVAVVDSGVAQHPMVAGKLYSKGLDYVDMDLDATNDAFGHGTMVAGILADCTRGVNVSILPVRVLGPSGTGTMSVVANGIRVAADRGASLINLSLEAPYSNTLNDAVNYALGCGIVVVAAAGNSNADTSGVSPACIMTPGMLVVGSATADGGKAGYSNYGTSVDVYAYGSGITSCSAAGGYKTDNGTSFAAPHITALAAMLRLLHPGLTNDAVEARVKLGAGAYGGICVPDLLDMIPEETGFSLTVLRADPGQILEFPAAALPERAGESIQYTSSDESVVRVQGNQLILCAEGTAQITAECFGIGQVSFTVSVEAAPGGTLRLGGAAALVEEEAFSHTGAADAVLEEGVLALEAGVFDGCSGLRTVTLPGSLEQFGGNTFSGAVLLCIQGTAAHAYARDNGLNYLLLPGAAG